MTRRFHVDTRERLVAVQRALDTAFGLRDAGGNPTPREQMVVHPVLGTVPASYVLGPAHSCYDAPGQHWPLVEGEDGSCAIEVAAGDPIDAKLGSTVRGTAIPRGRDLVAVSRPLRHDLLPAGVCAKLDDDYVEARLSGTDLLGLSRDTPAARAEITAELGQRAPAALARKDARGSLLLAARLVR